MPQMTSVTNWNNGGEQGGGNHLPAPFLLENQIMKYKVTVYHETYTDYIVEASDKDEAQDLAMMGEYDNIDDTTVKESEPVAVEKLED